jgi:2-polyprenyl-3-methyl-5-hydroxy-6-metoxy-1,4-benzoquinol methylase
MLSFRQRRMQHQITPEEQAASAVLCWCGSSDYESFSEHYVRCLACGTIHLRQPLPRDVAVVGADESGLYGEQYWFQHQSGDLRLPEIDSRSRTDLPERDLYWLRTLMKYKAPGSKLLEIGCAHGGFVALARQSGYDAIGMELSPAIVEYARRTFQAQVLCGPIERHSIAPGTFDVIAAMDVIEHFSDPLAEMEKYVRLLSPGGILLIQTPCLYRTDLTYGQLIESNDRFPLHLREKEHTFLFNKNSIQDFLRRLGFEYVRFEAQLFDYDMFFVSSRQPFRGIDRDEAENSLLATASGRTILALCDLEDRRQRENEQWQEAERDRAARLDALTEATEMIRAREQQVQAAELAAAERLESLNRASEIIQALERRALEAEFAASERSNALNRAAEIIQELERRTQEAEFAASERLDALNRGAEIIQELERRTQEAEFAAAERLEALNRANEIIQMLESTRNPGTQAKDTVRPV